MDPLGFFLCGLVFGIFSTVYIYKQYICVPATELWFFPDLKLPCNSLTGCRIHKCYKNDCSYLHSNSSLLKIIATLRGAKQIDLCMYRFTLPQIGNLFENMKKNGTRIRIITDNAKDPVEGNQIPRLKAAGIEVREKENLGAIEDRSRPLMHNKFVIVDNKCCLLGSFNWTYAAVTKNQESVIKSHEKEIVGLLVRKFNQMWNDLR